VAAALALVPVEALQSALHMVVRVAQVAICRLALAVQAAVVQGVSPLKQACLHLILAQFRFKQEAPALGKQAGSRWQLVLAAVALVATLPSLQGILHVAPKVAVFAFPVARALPVAVCDLQVALVPPAQRARFLSSPSLMSSYPVGAALQQTVGLLTSVLEILRLREVVH
jgi:hypothetical protein